MKLASLIETVRSMFQAANKRSTLWVIILVVILSIVMVNQSHAITPDNVHIQKLEGTEAGKKNVKMRKKFDAQSEDVWRLKDKDRKVSRGGNLSILNDGRTFANLAFFRGPKPIGLLVQTRLMPLEKQRLIQYDFPCEFRGAYIMAWKADRTSTSCNAEEGGIKINPQYKGFFSGIGNKQNADQQNSNELIIEPGQGQILIRTAMTGQVKPDYDGEGCNEIRNVNGQPTIGCNVAEVEVEVLEGEIRAKSGEGSQGIPVKQGEKYVHPGHRPQDIADLNKEANSCEILRFLNPAYWSSPETTQSIADDIAQQLKQHREALGVSGLPPGNPSELEQSIFNAMNRERARNNLPPFSVSKGMTEANRDHVKDQTASRKYTGHSGDRSISTASRLRQHGSVGCGGYDEDEFENIVYFKQSSIQGAPTGESVVKEMVTSSKPRLTGLTGNLLNRNFQVVGVGCGSEMCVATYAEGYRDKN